MFMLDLEKTEEQETKLPTSTGSQEKQENSRKTSASLTTLKPVTVWVIENCGKFFNFPDHLTCLLRNMYAGQEATVQTGYGTTDWFQVEKGVRQGCILSPCLFNLYIRHHNSISFADSHDHEKKMQSIPHYKVFFRTIFIANQF